MSTTSKILTPDQRLRVFVSSTLEELAVERRAVQDAIDRMRLVPVMFELGARPHPPRELYRAYLDQSDVFLGIYWQRYGWVAPGEEVSGLEDEYRLAGDRPRLIYLKEPAPQREDRLAALLADVRDDDRASYRRFTTADELAELVQHDLAVLLTERFATTAGAEPSPPSPPATGVPAALTRTVGRDDEVATVVGLLDAGVRLVTLTGLGGIGKTRIGHEVARARAEHLSPGAVRVLALATVTEPSALVAAIADRLGVVAVGHQAPMDALVDRLSARPGLLVLDNLEQVVEAGPDVAQLVARCPRLAVVVTSRQPLRVEGEHEVVVGPLEVPPADADVATARRSPAMQLLLDRARAVRGDLDLTEATVADLVALTRALDGLPLAIELAAARLRVLTPAQLRTRLGTRLDVLAGGRGRPERQRTLRATIDWSHQQLAPAEQALFARLGVFAGGGTLDAIESVCALGDETDDLLDTLAGLVDHSLVHVTDGAGDAPRFGMLEPVRRYALERLTERGEVVRLQDRHLRWFAAFTDRAQPFLCGPRQLQWADRVDPERANLRAAVDHALACGEVATAVAMAWDVYVYFFLRGIPDEPAAWMYRAAEQREALDEASDAILETAIAIDEIRHGRLDHAFNRLADALEVFDTADLALERAVAHMYRGLLLMERGDLPGAVEAQEVATAAFVSIDHDWGAASTEAFLGLLRWLQGDLPAARDHYDRSLALAERIANEQLIAQALVGLASVALTAVDLDVACAALAQAVPLIKQCHDAVLAATCLDVLAAAALARGRPVDALQAVATATGTRDRLGIPVLHVLRARVEHVRDRSWAGAADAADRLWREAYGRDAILALPTALAMAA